MAQLFPRTPRRSGVVNCGAGRPRRPGDLVAHAPASPVKPWTIFGFVVEGHQQKTFIFIAGEAR